MLDAPAAVLLARKGEDDLEGLERRRQEYLALESVLPAFRTVDANRPLDDVTDEVLACIVAFAGEPGRTDEAAAIAVPDSVEPIGPTARLDDVAIGAGS
jgi:hypothetical protein